MAAELGQQTVQFSSLVGRAADDSFLSLKELVEKCKSADQSDAEKKIGLLKYIVKTQQRMLRLNVLAKWCKQVPLIQYCQQLASTLSSHDTCFTQAADSLFFMHEGLQQARAPAYDVPSAVQVLLTGNYQRLPKCIEDIGAQGALNEEEQKPVLKELDMIVRTKLIDLAIPKEISEVKVFDGTVLLRVDGEFKVLLTLGYRGHLSMWRILHLEILVGEKSGPIKLEQSRRHVLGDDLERRMAAAENPFSTLYSILHELCVSLVMDTVIRQVQVLRLGRWKDAIRFELTSDGGVSHPGSSSVQMNPDGDTDSSSTRTPGLKILYWLELGRTSGAADSASPFIKIEPGPDGQTKCLHSTFVVDPLTGKEAEFSLNQSCIDVEKLLLRAIGCHRHTRLLEIQKELAKNVHISRSEADVKLKTQMDKPDASSLKKKDSRPYEEEYEGQEILHVRAYGSSFFTLGINIRNGRFILQTTGNILSASKILESEEALNQGNSNAAEVFTNLRSKSILQLFASVSSSLGLEAYEDDDIAIKIPESISNDTAMLLLGFPDCGSSYFLLLQLDNDFRPLFKLLEIQSDSSGKFQSFGDSKCANCFKNIDLDQMQIQEDDLNYNLIDKAKPSALLPSIGGPNNYGQGLLSGLGLDNSLEISGCPPSSFSSVVDEVFNLEKGSSVPLSSTQSFSAPASNYGSLPSNFHTSKAGSSSPVWDRNLSLSSLPSHLMGLSRGSLHSSLSSLSSLMGRSSNMKKLSTSKSEQDLASLRSPRAMDLSSFAPKNEDNLRLLDAPADDTTSGNSPSLLLASQGLPGTMPGNIIEPRSRKPKVPATNSVPHHGSSPEVSTKTERCLRKRTASDMLNLIPALCFVVCDAESSKRRRISEVVPNKPLQHQVIGSKENRFRSPGYTYGDLIADANKGNAPSCIYVSALLHVVRHCSLSIKHARLTSQMEAMDIPYVEEIGLRNASSCIWFRLPIAQHDSWHQISLRLGGPGTMYWDVKIKDQHFRDLWELQKGSSNTPWGCGVRIANTSDVDSHIRYDSDGVVLSYQSVEADSIKKLVSDVGRLSNARMFALGMRKLLGVKAADNLEEINANPDAKSAVGTKIVADGGEKFADQVRKVFRVEAVGLMSLWFSFVSGVLARFVVEWESGKDGCTMHVSPDQLWPHTKFLEDFTNGGEVASLLDCIRLTAGPLHSLAAATRPARAAPVSGFPGLTAIHSSLSKQTGYASSHGLLATSTTNAGQAAPATSGNPVLSATIAPSGNHNIANSGVLVAAVRGGPGIVPSSLLPIDVSVVLRGPYWIRIIYRKHFAVDMRCFAGDHVWLQPATPPKGGPTVGGSLPCPQFRPFIMEHVAQELNGLEPNSNGAQPLMGPANNSSSPNPGSNSQLGTANGIRPNPTSLNPRPGSQGIPSNRAGNAPSTNMGVVVGLPIRRSPGTNVPAHVRGELNTAIIGLGDDGGYGGGWVPLLALKKVLRGILKYLGVLWLFAQLPDLLKEILGSILNNNEGALLNLDQEQPALRFFVGGYVFAVSVHRVQLLLQVLSVKRFQQQQQQQHQQSSSSVQDELTQTEIVEICDYFSRRVASEPYDASRVASFITLLTLPIPVLREFLKLIAWKKGLSQAQNGDITPAQKPRIELCLENHSGFSGNDGSGGSSVSKSNIFFDRPRNSVDFALTVVLDPAHIPHINAAGGAAWLPYCVSVRLRYCFGENAYVTLIGMEGSHGGRACSLNTDDWEKCKQIVARTVEGSSGSGDTTQGRLKAVADSVQRALHLCLQSLKDGSGAVSNGSTRVGD
ncbi:hypothetical protein MLD38_020640 [Melastoma candidum]|uniref:Uncharacterized protein n=1 Tax=Melastoma candidum TaxID=119954 RepID=A0ACB9QE33_9MYRT|nr:hypothetical protein MLD38_020640 [Melastoma candidum]